MNDLQIENLKDLVLESLTPQEAQTIDLKSLVGEVNNYDVAESIVKDTITQQIRIKANEDYYKPIYRAINKMKANCCNAAFVKGKPGIGKSFNIKRALKMAGLDYVEIAGNVTEAFLYELLYKNNNKVIYFKDLSRLLQGLGSINLLKAATETDKVRKLTNNSYSHYQKNLPPSFDFKGKVIFDYNEIHCDLKGDFEALIGRGDYIQLVFTPAQVGEIMRNIAPNERDAETTEFCIEHTDPDNLNLRVQQKACLTREYAEKSGLDWKEEVKDELRKYKGKDFYKLYDIIGNESCTTVQLKRKLLNAGIVNSLRSADRKVSDLEFSGTLTKVDDAVRNYKVKLNW